MKRASRRRDENGARIECILELRQWASKNYLPTDVHEVDKLKHGKMYVIPMAWSDYRETEGLLLVSRKGVSWLLQILRSGLRFALHVDGKHKLHHGKWILVNVGVHSLEADTTHKKDAVRHSFRPVLHYFGKQHESEESMVMMLDGLSKVVKQFGPYDFTGIMAPTIGIWDRSAGLLAGWKKIFPEKDFATCWPHIARKISQGKYMSKGDPHYDDFHLHVQASIWSRREYLIYLRMT